MTIRAVRIVGPTKEIDDNMLRIFKNRKPVQLRVHGWQEGRKDIDVRRKLETFKLDSAHQDIQTGAENTEKTLKLRELF